jgi:ribokinase
MFLRSLLDAKEPQFSFAMNKLERAAGKNGVDVRLIADIMASSHTFMRTIGLDPNDTTYQELRRTLTARSGDELLFTNTTYVGLVFPEGVVSFNHQDVLAGHTLDHLRGALQHELVGRYVSHPRTADAVVEQFARDAGLWYTTDNHKQEQTEETDTVDQPYILSIGDIVTDAFIKLLDDQARIDVDPDGSKRLSMDFGSKPPYDYVDVVQAVGNSANAAVAFARLGLNAGLMAWLGDDQAGKDSFKYLESEHVDTTPVSVAEGMKSNYHFALRYGADRTILIKYEDYAYNWKTPERTPDYIYLSMISESSWQLHEDMLAYLAEHPETKLVFQPGTFHFKWGIEKLAAVYRRSYLVVMNREEAALVTGKSTESIPELMRAMHELGPEVVIITDGPDGAYASDGERTLMMPNYPDPAPPYDRTGAGDAFASTIVAALALGESLETALAWAPINSMSVVQKLGAQAGLLHRDAIEGYLHDAPEDYHTKEIS